MYKGDKFPSFIEFSNTSDLSTTRAYYCPIPVAAVGYTFHIEFSQEYFGYDICSCSDGYYGKPSFPFQTRMTYAKYYLVYNPLPLFIFLFCTYVLNQECLQTTVRPVHPMQTATTAICSLGSEGFTPSSTIVPFCLSSIFDLNCVPRIKSKICLLISFYIFISTGAICNALQGQLWVKRLQSLRQLFRHMGNWHISSMHSLCPGPPTFSPKKTHTHVCNLLSMVC